MERKMSLKELLAIPIAWLVVGLIAIFVVTRCDSDFAPENERVIYFDELGNCYEESIDPSEVETWEPPKMVAPYPDSDTIPTTASSTSSCSSLIEISDPFFLSMGSAAGNLMATTDILWCELGGIKDTIVYNGVVVQPFSDVITSTINAWFLATGNSYQEMDTIWKFQYDSSTMLLVVDFWMVLKGSTADEFEIPYLKIRIPGTQVWALKDDRAIYNTMMGETETLKLWFLEYTSLKSFTLWGGVGQLNAEKAVNILIDACKQAPTGARASLNGIELDSTQLIYLDTAGWIITF